MAEFFDVLLPLSHWSWWIAAIVLILLELAAPGVAFLWLGIAAGIVGLLVYFVPSMDWKSQLAIFAVLAVVSAVLSRRYLHWKPLETDRPNLNRRGDSYIGREYVLDQDIAGGTGDLKVDDTRWQVRGPNLPAGTRVRVTGVEGATLQVVDAAEPAETPGDATASD
jgi:membrane protein implicated in regulation of membrane protease activity